MEKKGASENFQPHMVASFNKVQLEQVLQWLAINNVATNLSFVDAINTSPLDEKGKPIGEKSRKRLSYGISAIITMSREGQDLSRVRSIQVWQITPDQNKLDIRWDAIETSRNFGQRRY